MSFSFNYLPRNNGIPKHVRPSDKSQNTKLSKEKEQTNDDSSIFEQSRQHCAFCPIQSVSYTVTKVGRTLARKLDTKSISCLIPLDFEGFCHFL